MCNLGVCPKGILPIVRYISASITLWIAIGISHVAMAQANAGPTAHAINFQFGPGVNSHYPVEIPPEWNNKDVSVEMTATVSRISSDVGSAGNLTYSWTAGSDSDQYTITNIPPMAADGSPGVRAFTNRWIVKAANSVAPSASARSFEIRQLKCWGQNSPAGEQSSCTISGTFLLVPY